MLVAHPQLPGRAVAPREDVAQTRHRDAVLPSARHLRDSLRISRLAPAFWTGGQGVIHLAYPYHIRESRLRNHGWRVVAEAKRPIHSDSPCEQRAVVSYGGTVKSWRK